MNAEVVARLQRSLDADDVLGGGDALDTAAYQAMAAVVLGSSIDHTALTAEQDKALAQLSKIGSAIIARMELTKGDKNYITRVIRPPEQDPPSE